MKHPVLQFFSSLIVAGLSLLMIGLLAAMAVFYHYAHDLPDYSQLANYNPAVVTRLYAGDGKLLAEYATQRRIYTPLTAIPRRVIQAFLSAEDKNFYQHDGIDLTGIARALRENAQNLGHGRLVGGSTITQQVVKNFLLTNEQSVERKIKEAILAFRISQAYSKDRILELYLNEIYLGRGSYGVAAAALNYFNKSLDELTLEEVALLAAMPKAPANYDPARFPDRAKSRRDWVLARMAEDGHANPEEVKLAIAQPVMLRVRDETETTEAGFFSEEVRRRLAAMFGYKTLYEGGLTVRTTLNPALQRAADKALQNALVAYDRRHGWRGPVLRMPASLDWKARLANLPPEIISLPLIGAQQFAMVLNVKDSQAEIGLANGETGVIPLPELQWARRELPDLVLGPAVTKASDVLAAGDIIIAAPKEEEKPDEKNKDDKKKAEKKKSNLYSLHQIPAVNGAMVVMEPHTGRVLALTGGYAYGKSEFNRATQAKRQPGSAFKPFVYLSALERGYTPASIILDAPVELNQGAGLPAWKPQNYKDEYLGPATLRRGVEKSRNAMTVRLALALGIDKIIGAAKRFGIYDDIPRNFSIVLGSAETTLLRLTSAYAMLDNGGYKVTPALIERIDDHNGKTIFRRDTRVCPGCVMNAAMPVDATTPPTPPDNRERVVDERIAYQITSILEGVVQRGTATKALAVGKPLAGKTGTTNDSRDTWFVGFSPDLVAGVFIGFDTPKPMGKKETGGAVALPAFVEFMQTALKDTPAKPFHVPLNVQLVKTDYLSGQTYVAGEVDGKHTIYEAFLSGPGVYIPGEEQAPSITPPTPPVAEPPPVQDAPPVTPPDVTDIAPTATEGASVSEPPASEEMPSPTPPRESLSAPRRGEGNGRHRPLENFHPNAPAEGTGGIY